MEKKLLIVDDDPDIRNIFEQALSRKGYIVQLSESAEDALELLKQHPINVMFLDLKLPGMNGIELCKQIRRNNPMAVIYAVTGYSALFQVVDCRDAGFDDYYTKPVDIKILLKAALDAFDKIDRWQ